MKVAFLAIKLYNIGSHIGGLYDSYYFNSWFCSPVPDS